jgi:hypothetical protein
MSLIDSVFGITYILMLIQLPFNPTRLLDVLMRLEHGSFAVRQLRTSNPSLSLSQTIHGKSVGSTNVNLHQLVGKGSLVNVRTGVTSESWKRYRGWLAQIHSMRSALQTVECPPPYIKLDSGQIVTVGKEIPPAGTIRRLQAGPIEGKPGLLRVATCISAQGCSSLIQENITLRGLEGLEFVPRAVNIPYLDACSLIMSLSFETPGVRLSTLPQGRLSIEQVLQVGSRLVEMIRLVHERGFIHGHMKEGVLYRDEENLVESLFLDHFEDSSFFVESGHKRHIAKLSPVDMIPIIGDGFITSSESIFQLREPGQRKSRADDIFTIAEILVDLIQGQPEYEPGNIQKWIQVKSCRVLHELPEGVQKFYEYALNLGFEDQPDYVSIRNSLKHRSY